MILTNKKVINLYKRVGYTPLQELNNLRREFTELKDKKMAYAGRLDPFAQGVMLVLIDEECKHRDKYQALAKEYMFEILVGFSTDTYDLLGKITAKQEIDKKNILQKVIEKIENFPRQYLQTFAPFSSKTIDGVPLYKLSRAGKTQEKSLPKKLVKIKEIKYLSYKLVGPETILNKLKKQIKTLEGDFRQRDILAIWKKELDYNAKYLCIKAKASVSTGTYIRTLINDLGNSLDIPTVAYSILRNKVGEYKISESLELN